MAAAAPLGAEEDGQALQAEGPGRRLALDGAERHILLQQRPGPGRQAALVVALLPLPRSQRACQVCPQLRQRPVVQQPPARLRPLHALQHELQGAGGQAPAVLVCRLVRGGHCKVLAALGRLPQQLVGHQLLPHASGARHGLRAGDEEAALRLDEQVGLQELLACLHKAVPQAARGRLLRHGRVVIRVVACRGAMASVHAAGS